MYLPPHFAVTNLDEIVSSVESIGAVDLITVDPAGHPQVTLMPVIWDRRDWNAEKSNFGTLRMHMARANKHWESIIDGSVGLAILHGPQAYVSPSAYESKREHGRVVPTWNYTSMHFEGEVSISHDVEQLRQVVSELTDLHEARRDRSWYVTDAPESYIEGQLRGIVGITLRITGIEAKAKLSQNRSVEDRMGVANDLRQSTHPGDGQIAEMIDRSLF